MAFRFGSDRSSTNQNLSSTLDALGNPIISADLSFGASPLGEAARTQVALGVPNGTFNLLPNDPFAEIDSSNPIPYWSWEASGSVIATMNFDNTAQTWSVVLDPETAGSGDYGILKTRIPIVNDEGLDIRHFVSSSLIQGVKPFAPKTEWTMDLTAQYIDTTGAAIGTAYTIGTITEAGTATNLSSYTNDFGPIDTTAAELEIAYTITRGATGDADVSAIIKSVLVATDYGAIGGGGGSAGNVTWQTDIFTESGTWEKPADVNYVTIVAMGGGQGGASGAGHTSIGGGNALGGSGGASGSWVILPDVYVTGDVSIGVGAGGAGGVGGTGTKSLSGSVAVNVASNAGAAGGASTFGSYLSVGGGGGTTVTRTYWNTNIVAGTSAPSVGTANGNTHAIAGFTSGAPFTTFTTGGTGNYGTTGSVTGATSFVLGSANSANGSAGIGPSGGNGGTATSGSSPNAQDGRISGNGEGGTGGGGVAGRVLAQNLTVTAIGGNGGDGLEGEGGAGGGGGGGASTVGSAFNNQFINSTITIIPGNGGWGGDGFVAVSYLVNV